MSSLKLFKNGTTHMDKAKDYKSIAWLNRLQQVGNERSIADRKAWKAKNKSIKSWYLNIISSQKVSRRCSVTLEGEINWIDSEK